MAFISYWAQKIFLILDICSKIGDPDNYEKDGIKFIANNRKKCRFVLVYYIL